MKRVAILIYLFLASLASASEYSISLTTHQRTKLVELIKSDKDAQARFETLKHVADKALDDTPNPIKTIQSEGKLKTDPAKIKTSESMADMGKVNALAYAFAVTADARYGDKAREFVLAWAHKNVPNGDPIDDTSLDHLFVAYDLTRAHYSADDKKSVETWIRHVADTEISHLKKSSGTAKNNWHSHRLKIIGLAGYAIADAKLIDYAIDGFKKQIEGNLKPDGSSLDFHERDALHYHCYDLEPLLVLAIAAAENGTALYPFRAASGSSLDKSVKFLVPYCTGAKTHPEFVHSNVAFDKKRAESGDEHYKAGRLFSPKSGGHTLELAAFFDSSYMPIYCQATGATASKFPSWQFVLNAVRAK
ncbi:MAG: alginate lyase family protein [Planctomycetota bacterium]